MNKIQLVTGICAAALAALHTFVGTPEVAEPLLTSTLEDRAKYIKGYDEVKEENGMIVIDTLGHVILDN